ncbi:leucine-rich repeat domain-containing protein [Candidatus Bipolaricaulota bacterium]
MGVILALSILVATVSVSAVVVTFPDANLEQVIRDAIGKPTGDIDDSDLVGLTNLDGSSKYISNLEGLQHCTDLVTLDLSDNYLIVDLTPLAPLTDLVTLNLEGNDISSVAPLAGLVNLTYLNVNTNDISDISALALLTNLLEFHAWENDIVSVSVLAGMTSLAGVSLFENLITDITPLAGLTNLTLLALQDNQIADISPLAALTNLTALTLGSNPITDFTVLTGLVNLQLLELEWVRLTDLEPLVLNAGLGAGDGIYIRYNHLCLSPGSDDQLDIDTLVARGATVSSDSQLFCPESAAVFRVSMWGHVEIDGALYGAAFETGAADIAEWVHISTPAVPGDVVEFDPMAPGQYRMSQNVCSSLVAGVISTTPGVTLGRSLVASEKALLALIGIVPVKVTNEGGSIHPGDLLVTSSAPGHAMRWAGPDPCLCSLVGKALEPMNEEQGVILVLLTSH